MTTTIPCPPPPGCAPLGDDNPHPSTAVATMTYEQALMLCSQFQDAANRDAGVKPETYRSLDVTIYRPGDVVASWWDVRLCMHLRPRCISLVEETFPTISDALSALVTHVAVCYEWERRARAEQVTP